MSDIHTQRHLMRLPDKGAVICSRPMVRYVSRSAAARSLAPHRNHGKNYLGPHKFATLLAVVAGPNKGLPLPFVFLVDNLLGFRSQPT